MLFYISTAIVYSVKTRLFMFLCVFIILQLYTLAPHLKADTSVYCSNAYWIRSYYIDLQLLEIPYVTKVSLVRWSGVCLTYKFP